LIRSSEKPSMNTKENFAVTITVQGSADSAGIAGI
jgi:hypothetical protein